MSLSILIKMEKSDVLIKRMKPLNPCGISRQHQLGQGLSTIRTKKQGGHSESLVAYTKHHSCKRVLSTPVIIPLISQMFPTELCSLIEYQKWFYVHFSSKRSYGSNLCSHRFLPVSYPLSSYLFFQSQLWFRYKLWESFIQCH